METEWFTRMTVTDGDTLYSIDPNHIFRNLPARLRFDVDLQEIKKNAGISRRILV